MKPLQDISPTQNSMPAKRSLTDLPPEVVDLIIEFASTEELIELSRTCHFLYSATLPFLWRHVQIGTAKVKHDDITYVENARLEDITEWPRARQIAGGIDRYTYEECAEDIEHFFRALEAGDISRRALECVQSMIIYIEFSFGGLDLEHFGFGTAGTAMPVGEVHDSSLKILKNLFLNPDVLPNLHSVGIFPSESLITYGPNGMISYNYKLLKALERFKNPLNLYLSEFRSDELIKGNILPAWKVLYLDLAEKPKEGKQFANLLRTLTSLRVLKMDGTFGMKSWETGRPGNALARLSIETVISELPDLEVLALNYSVLGSCPDAKFISDSNINYLGVNVKFSRTEIRRDPLIHFQWDALRCCAFKNLRTLSMEVAVGEWEDYHLGYNVNFHNLSEVYIYATTAIPKGLDALVFEANKKLKKVVVPSLSDEGVVALSRCPLIETICLVSANVVLAEPRRPFTRAPAVKYTEFVERLMASTWPHLSELYISTIPEDLVQSHIDAIVTGNPALNYFGMGYKGNKYFSSKPRYPSRVTSDHSSNDGSSSPSVEPRNDDLSMDDPHQPREPEAFRDPFYDSDEEIPGTTYIASRPKAAGDSVNSLDFWKSVTEPTHRYLSSMKYKVGNVIITGLIYNSKVITLDVVDYRKFLEKA